MDELLMRTTQPVASAGALGPLGSQAVTTQVHSALAEGSLFCSLSKKFYFSWYFISLDLVLTTYYFSRGDIFCQAASLSWWECLWQSHKCNWRHSVLDKGRDGGGCVCVIWGVEGAQMTVSRHWLSLTLTSHTCLHHPQRFASDKLPVSLVRDDDYERTWAHTGTCMTNYPDKNATTILAAR